MTDSPVIVLPALGQAWEGDWRARVLERIRIRGFDTISAFTDSRPTTSLIALAEELSTSDTDRINRADVCAEQIARLWRDEAGKQGPNAAEHMARRLLVGELYLDLPQGWSNDWASSEQSMSRISMAMSSWAAHVGPEYGDAADRVIRGMLDEGPTGRIPNGWLPANSEDPILLDIFARCWRGACEEPCEYLHAVLEGVAMTGMGSAGKLTSNLPPPFQASMCLLIVATISCGGHANLQCAQDSNCDLASGGVCRSPGTGNRWCAYPDAICPSGYRYSGVQVGDGVSGMCVTTMDDGGTDGPQSQSEQSCVALPSTCGASGTDSVAIVPLSPGAGFFRSYDVATDHSSGTLIGEPVDMNSPATVSNFRLDKYEVTVGRFRAFVAAGQGTQMMHPAVGDGTHPKISGSGWEAAWNASLIADTASLTTALKCTDLQRVAGFATWTDAPGPNEDRPINCVTWYEAMAFCAWDGGYLPTEAEWNYAAGDLTVDGMHASYADGTSDNPDCHGDGVTGCALTDIVDVGTKPAGDGKWGQSDLAGNLDEWILDYHSDGYVSPCADCANSR